MVVNFVRSLPAPWWSGRGFFGQKDEKVEKTITFFFRFEKRMLEEIYLKEFFSGEILKNFVAFFRRKNS